MPRNYNEGLKDFVLKCYEFSDDDNDDQLEFFEDKVDDFFNACLNDLQQNRTKDEYLELMVKLEKREALFRDDPEENTIDNVADDDAVIRAYNLDYQVIEDNTDEIYQFLQKHGANRNFLEDNINETYDRFIGEPIDLSEVSQNFKQEVTKTLVQSKLEYTADNIKQYLDNENFDNNLIDRKGHTLMTAACLKADDDTAFEMLNRNDVDLNKPNENGETPFTLACQHHPDLAIEMVGCQDIDLNARNKNGETGFHCAVKENPELGVALMDCDGIDLNMPENQDNLFIKGNTPFISACEQANDCAYEMLKRNDIDFNAQNANGETAFIKACQTVDMSDVFSNVVSTGDYDLAYEMTKNSQIELEAKNEDGYTAFDYCETDASQHVKQRIQEIRDNKTLKQSINSNQPENKNKMKML